MAAVVLLSVVALAILLGVRLGHRARERGRECASRAAGHRIAVEHFPNGAVLLFDRRLRHTLAGGCGLEDMGLSGGTLERRTLHEAFPPEVCAILEPVYRAALEGRESVLELPLANRDYLVQVVPVRDEAGTVVSGMVVAQDMTDRKRREHRLTELASRDGLTGLWNRRRLTEELERLLRKVASGRGLAGSLLLLDLDGFKQVNDTLGHDAGDGLLRRVARTVEACVRRTDAAARLGGDEFAVLLPGATPEEARRVAEKIAVAIDAVWPLGARGGASVGVAAVGLGNWTAADVLASADRAMYVVKRGQRLRAAS